MSSLSQFPSLGLTLLKRWQLSMTFKWNCVSSHLKTANCLSVTHGLQSHFLRFKCLSGWTQMKKKELMLWMHSKLISIMKLITLALEKFILTGKKQSMFSSFNWAFSSFQCFSFTQNSYNASCKRCLEFELR